MNGKIDGTRAVDSLDNQWRRKEVPQQLIVVRCSFGHVTSETKLHHLQVIAQVVLQQLISNLSVIKATGGIKIHTRKTEHR